MSGAFRDEWGIQHPPSVWVGRSYSSRAQAEASLSFEPTGVLVHRFVTEWETAPTEAATSEEGRADG